MSSFSLLNERPSYLLLSVNW